MANETQRRRPQPSLNPIPDLLDEPVPDMKHYLDYPKDPGDDPEPDPGDEDEGEPEPEPPPPPVERKTNGTVTTKGARELVRARWATESAVRDDLKSTFEDIEMEKGLSLLARMRDMCELAARTLEKRRTEETDNTACVICKVTKKKLGNRNWRMVRPRRDTRTGTMYTDYFCSDACIVEENRQKYGVAAMSDRGMLPGDDPASAKNSIIAHQAKVKAEYDMQQANEKIRKG